MLTKEEIIILRTIFLEFGDEELRQQRLGFPYENLEYENTEDQPNPLIGKRYKANISALIENHKLFKEPATNEIASDFFSYIVGDNSDVGGDFEGVIIVEGKQSLVDRENGNVFVPDEKVLLEINDHSKNDFFINLRKGLYYKNRGNHEKAIEPLKIAHRTYSKTFYDTINTAAEQLHQFLEQFYDFSKKVIKEQYSIEKHGPLPEVTLPPELLISIEEMPSFHLGEHYLDIANENFTDYQDSKNLSILDISKENYARAIDYLEESDKWCKVLYNGQDLNDSLISQIKQFDVIPFPISPFKRNSYWEVNHTTARNQLKRIEEEKFLSTIKVVEKPDPVFIEKAVSEERKKREELTEKFKKYETIFPDPGKISLPSKVQYKLIKILLESEGVLYWLSRDFPGKGLKYLADTEVDGKIKEIRILAGPTNIDNDFRGGFKKFKERVESNGNIVEMKVVIEKDVVGEMHDRWIITDKNAYNVPLEPLELLDREGKVVLRLGCYCLMCGFTDCFKIPVNAGSSKSGWKGGSINNLS